jgi:hypothetical protein
MARATGKTATGGKKKAARKRLPDTSKAGKVRRAARALKEYKLRTEGGDAVTDLLTDLRLLCAARGFEFGELLRVSEGHFDAEK